MKLMIVESSGKIAKLSAILGEGWKVAASVGHVRDLPQKEMGVAAPYFLPRYELTERGADVVNRLKNLARNAEAVYLATDPDREGESISWHLQLCLKLEDPLRITFDEITATAVKASLASPRKIDVNRVAAQEARRVLDRLVGYMVSPQLSDHTGTALSAGRVQSPAVRLVVERERAIRAFTSTHHFSAALIFPGNEGEWSAEWLTKPEFATEEEPYFLDRAFAAKVAEVTTVRVVSSAESQARRSPPPPFITSTLQQAASVVLSLDPKATMDAAQKLYEQGHITYHRTDNPNVSEESLGDIHAEAAKLGLPIAESPRKFKAPDGAQVGHPAITPTHWDIAQAGESPQQQALYKLIRLRSIACQLADARYAVRTARLEAVDLVGRKRVQFEGKGRTLTAPGWLALTAGDQTEDESEKIEPTNPVPLLQPDQELTVARGKLLEKKTKAPSRFTQASLVAKLESEGIGRPATYASIMDNIVRRGYVRADKKFLAPTPTGELVVDALVGKFQFMDLGFTREVEEDLDRIARGELGYRPVVTKVHEQLQRELATLQIGSAAKHPCPQCERPLRRIKGPSGHFWGCTGHPACKATLPDDNGEPGRREVSGHNCPDCGKPLVHRLKKGKGGYDFWGCSGYRDGCRVTFPSKDGAPLFQPEESVAAK
jgi:DNA topoisomerase-1